MIIKKREAYYNILRSLASNYSKPIFIFPALINSITINPKYKRTPKKYDNIIHPIIHNNELRKFLQT